MMLVNSFGSKKLTSVQFAWIKYIGSLDGGMRAKVNAVVKSVMNSQLQVDHYIVCMDIVHLWPSGSNLQLKKMHIIILV